jgi:cytochrome c oxidase subunit 2
MQISLPPVVGISLFPDEASNLAGPVDLLYLALTALTFVILFILAVPTIYFIVKYRRSANVDRSPSTFSTLKLELAWTIVPFFIVMGIFAWGGGLFVFMRQVPTDATEIHVIGKQWMWKIQHLQGKREINELHVPLGRTVKLLMASQDVIHSFFLPAFRVKQDVIPGRYTTQWFRPTKTGTYPIYCAEFCGTQHSSMIGKVTVMEPQEFDQWLQTGEAVPLAQSGARLFRSLGCSGCHTPGGVIRAPLLNNLYGKPVALENGRVVRADDRYIRDSILLPQTEVTAGYQTLMPSFQGQVSEEQVLELVTYIKSLGSTNPASDNR